jgi:5-methylcytosine-specific restriction endonuclease McrA
VRILHIVQGGIENGDKAWLEKAARLKRDAKTWVAPKSARVGDEVVIYVLDQGFFATARVGSLPQPRSDWPNRYGVGLTSIRLITPAISIGMIRQAIPELKWAEYPRSITTPPPRIAERIRNMIARRRKTGLPDLKEKVLGVAGMDELRAVAISCARPSVGQMRRSAICRLGSQAIVRYVQRRANGQCEGCDAPSPFRKLDGSPYLESHHTTRRADEGPDHPAHVIALCPNCHRRAHHAIDAEDFNDRLKRRLAKLERRYATRVRHS